MTLHMCGKVVEVDGRRVKFRVEAWYGVERITEGVHERKIIDLAKLNARMAEKKVKPAA